MEKQKNLYKISVIVPIYNIEEYISKCIESIIVQTYSNLEIILVDDGSTDSSGKICDTYAKQDDRIQVIHQINLGLVMARKAGLAVAAGDYIGFVDGDDYIEPNFYETLLNYIIEDQVDFVHTGYIYEKNEVNIKICQFETKIYELNKDVTAEIINEYVLGDPDEKNISSSIWSKLYKADFIKKCYNFVPANQSMGEDLICLCVCLLEGKKVSFHKVALYHYVYRCNSLVNSYDITNTPEKIGIYYCLLNIFDFYSITEQVKINWNRSMLSTIISCLSQNKKFCDFINLYIFGNVDLIKGKKIVLYGAGMVGQGYYSQLCKYTSCSIVGWVDEDYENIHFDFTDVVGVEEIKNIKYDLVLIAIKNSNMAEEIKEKLQDIGVPEQKIVWEKPRKLI